MFGSFKIIQTFHRVWTTQELQSFSKYTKCVHHSGWVIWADCEPWKSTAPGKSCLWTNWWDLKDMWLLSLDTFQNPTGKWLTQPWVGSHELWAPWQSGPHIYLQSLESSRTGHPWSHGHSGAAPSMGTHPPPIFPSQSTSGSGPWGPALRGSQRWVAWNNTTSQVHGPRSSIFCLLI